MIQINIFMVICAVLMTKYQISAQTARCDYSYKMYDYSETNISYYSCVLSTEQANFDTRLTSINGQHGFVKDDDDVGYFVNYVNNKLKVFTSIFCQKFQNLEAILLGNAGIESIDADAFTNCRNLIYLELYGNQIHSLPSYVFTPLKKLEWLLFTQNHLKSINPDSFTNLPNLTWLKLNENEITEIPPKAFTSLKKLESLHLVINKINKLYSESFEGLDSLYTLMLHINEIPDLPVGVFVPLKALYELVLRNNKLTTVHSDSFGNHPKLEDIYLANNPITSIDEKIVNKTLLSYINLAKNICYNGKIETRDEIKTKLRECFDNYKPRYQPSSQSSTTVTCGKSMSGQGNVIGGKYANRGDFPWIAALVGSNGGYFCGGTLVTSRKIITAAHCMQEKGIRNQLLPSMFVALLGVYNLNNSIEIGRTPYAIQSVNIHPEWSSHSENFDADIAVLVLETEVTYNKYILPSCVAFSGSNAATITKGIVVGFGQSEDTTKVHETIPKVLEMPIHSNDDCFFKFHALLKLSSKRTFCGGTGNGVGVCRGDSGGGLFVYENGAFSLRGIISSSLIGGPYGCDVDVYSVFTDVTKYTEWINKVSLSRFD